MSEQAAALARMIEDAMLAASERAIRDDLAGVRSLPQGMSGGLSALLPFAEVMVRLAEALRMFEGACRVEGCFSRKALAAFDALVKLEGE